MRGKGGMLMIAVQTPLYRRPTHILFSHCFETHVMTRNLQRMLDQLVSNSSRRPLFAKCRLPLQGKVPAKMASLMFDYAIDPTGPPVPAAPTEWPLRVGTLPDGCTSPLGFIMLSCFPY